MALGQCPTPGVSQHFGIPWPTGLLGGSEFRMPSWGLGRPSKTRNGSRPFSSPEHGRGRSGDSAREVFDAKGTFLRSFGVRGKKAGDACGPVRMALQRLFGSMQ